MTSHDVVARVRRLAGTRKVGHAGTLDPMATGVLLVGVNRATRLLGHLTLTEKAYDATVRLGARTTTDDAEGETAGDARRPRTSTEDDVRAAAGAFVGDIEQLPSRSRRSRSTASGPTRGSGPARTSSCRPAPVTVHELAVDRRARATATSLDVDVSRALQQRHLHPGDRPRPRRGARRRRTPHRAPAYGGRRRSTLAEAHTLDELADDLARRRHRRRGAALLPVVRPRRRRRPATSASAASSTLAARRAGPGGGVRARTASSWRSTSSAATSRPARWPSSSDDPVGERRPSSTERGRPPCRSGARSTRCPRDLGRTVVTVGNFDGVHLGHQHVLSAGP